MNESIKDIKTYIEKCPPDIRMHLYVIYECIKLSAPQEEEVIKYDMPTFFFYENLFHFVACKSHIGFYPTPSTIIFFKEEVVQINLEFNGR